MRLGRPIVTDTRHVPRWALALALGLVALAVLATRARRSSPPHAAPVGRTADIDPEPSTTSEPATPAEPEAATEPADPRTRQELYAEAQRLGIPGRSKMRRDELARAVADWTG